MAFGFTPKYIETYLLNGLSNEHFLVIAHEAVSNLGWQVNYVSNTGLIAFTNAGMFKWNAEISIKIENGTAILKSESTGNEMMDWGKNKKAIGKLVAELNALASKYSVQDLNSKYNSMAEAGAITPDEDDIMTLPPQTTAEKWLEFGGLFVPKEGYYITPILVDLNILIFIIMALTGVSILSPDTESLLKWGANFRPVTLAGEWWRLITCCFLHIGILHLLMNMYALVYIGVLLEPILGKLRFIVAYLLTGLTASMLSLWYHDFTVSAGASGAIFGMYGVFLALLSSKLIDEKNRKALLASIGVFVVYNLLNGMKGGIDNAAHLGGLIGGAVIGYCYLPSLKNPESGKLKHVTIWAVALLIIGASAFAYKNVPNDFSIYEAKMKEFDAYEKRALTVYDLNDTVSNATAMAVLKDTSIYYIEKKIGLLHELDKLTLPEHIAQRNQLLKKYSQTRLKLFKMTYEGLKDPGQSNAAAEDSCKKEIELIIKELDK